MVGGVFGKYQEVGVWDVDQGVGQMQLCSNQATQTITYVVAVDNMRGT